MLLKLCSALDGFQVDASEALARVTLAPALAEKHRPVAAPPPVVVVPDATRTVWRPRVVRRW